MERRHKGHPKLQETLTPPGFVWPINIFFHKLQNSRLTKSGVDPEFNPDFDNADVLRPGGKAHNILVGNNPE